MNGIPLINGYAYGWANIVCTIAGIPVTGITAIDYADDQEVNDHYGAGRYPVSRGKGRITTTAKITLYMDELMAIQRNALNGRIQDIAAFTIQVNYIPDLDAVKKPVTDTLMNCQFKKNQRIWKEGDTRQEVELDLQCSHIKWGK